MSFVPLSSLTCGGNESNTEAAAGAPERSPQPLVKTFATREQYYAYDVNTGVIVQLSEILCVALDARLEQEPTGGEKPASAPSKYSPQELAKAAKDLDRLTSVYGLFKPIKIASRMHPPSIVRDNIERMVGHLGQLTLSIVEQCNLRCSYCSFSGGYPNIRVHNETMMTWETAKRAIDHFLANVGYENSEITFYGGEPLINFPLIKRIIAYVRALNSTIQFGMTTNGTLIDERVGEFLAQHDVRLTLSLDGPEDIHDRERRFIGGQTSFQKIMQVARRHKRLHPDHFNRKIKFWCTLHPSNQEATVMQFFLDNPDIFGPGRVGFGRVVEGHASYSVDRQSGSNSILDLEDRYLSKVAAGELGDREFSYLRELFEKSYMKIQNRRISPDGFGEHTHLMGACFPGTYRLFVKANGDYQVCEKSNDALVIGNVNEGLKLDKIFDIYRTFYELHNNECCRCWAYRFCGSCYASSTRGTGRFEAGLDPAFCSKEKAGWARRLSKYAAVAESNDSAFEYMEAVDSYFAPIPVLDEGVHSPAMKPLKPMCR